MLEILNTAEEYSNFTSDGQLMNSGDVYYVREDNSAHFITNNVDGNTETFNANGDAEAVEDFISFVEGGDTVVIPKGATKIGQYVFNGNTKIKTVEISDTVEKIETAAFYGCTNLESIYIPDSVKQIEYNAFHGNAKLPRENNVRYADNCAVEKISTTPAQFTFKDGTRLIANSLFQNDNNITSVTIPNTVKYIDYGAFFNCSALTNVTLGEGLLSINEVAFAECSSLISVTIPNSVTTIGMNAFSACGLTSITIPNNVTTIGMNAFFRCPLTSFVVDSNNTVYDSRDNCNALIETSTNKLLQGFATTVIPNSVTSIGHGAFNSCNGLTSITIPDSVTIIDIYAFAYSTDLVSVIIENGITSIGQNAFYECSDLASVTVEATTPPTLGSQAFAYNAEGRKIYVPAGSVAAYKVASGWSDYANDIKAIVE